MLFRSASITVGGLVLGTPDAVNNLDTFGFTAQEIGSFTLGGNVIKLLAPLSAARSASPTT